MNFQQLGSETMYEAWKRFKELMKKCPQHGVEDQMQLTIFYNSLFPDAKVILDASAGGSFMMKTVSSAKKLLDDMASNHAKWQVESRSQPKKAGVYEIDQPTFIQAQLAALSKQVSDLKIQNQRVETCILCSGNHSTLNCTATMESVQYVRNQGNFSNYNNVQPQ